MKTRAKVLIAVGCTAAVASAQLFDPGQIALLKALAQEYIELQRILAASQSLVDQYKRAALFAVDKNSWIPNTAQVYSIPTTPNVYGTSAGWIQAVNTGTGIAGGYNAATIPLKPYSSDVWNAMSGAQKDAFARQYATVELTDAVNQNALAIAGAYRAQQAATGGALAQLEIKARSQNPDDNTAAALANQTVAAGILHVREQEATNQLLATLVEQQAVIMKRQRDNDAEAIRSDQAERAAAMQAKPLGATTLTNMRWN